MHALFCDSFLMPSMQCRIAQMHWNIVRIQQSFFYYSSENMCSTERECLSV